MRTEAPVVSDLQPVDQEARVAELADALDSGSSE